MGNVLGVMISHIRVGNYDNVCEFYELFQIAAKIAESITLIEMGRELIGVRTALDLDQGIEIVERLIEEARNGGR